MVHSFLSQVTLKSLKSRQINQKGEWLGSSAHTSCFSVTGTE
jgi:hypothetical protein